MKKSLTDGNKSLDDFDKIPLALYPIEIFDSYLFYLKREPIQKMSKTSWNYTERN